MCGSFIFHKDGYAVYFIFPVALTMIICLPTRNDQGGALDPKAESRSGRLAEKALYCASEVLRIAFSGRHPPCAPICMRALRARLHQPNRTEKE